MAEAVPAAPINSWHGQQPRPFVGESGAPANRLRVEILEIPLGFLPSGCASELGKHSSFLRHAHTKLESRPEGRATAQVYKRGILSVPLDFLELKKKFSRSHFFCSRENSSLRSSSVLSTRVWSCDPPSSSKIISSGDSLVHSSVTRVFPRVFPRILPSNST